MIRFALSAVSGSLLVAGAVTAAAVVPPPDTAGHLASVRVAIIGKGDVGHYAGMCGTGTGIDSLGGVLELESVDEDGQTLYKGDLTRVTEVDACGTRPAPTVDQVVMCLAHLSGTARMEVTVEVYADDRGAYIKMEPITAWRKSINGCPEPAEWLDSYPTDGWMSGVAIDDVPSGPLLTSREYTTGNVTLRVY